jgi:hypothetical protein
MILSSKYNFLKPYKVKKLIRFGRNFDGGYLVCSDAIQKIENLITLGVGDDISFEIDIEKDCSLKKVHLYDFTVNHLLFVRIIIKYIRRIITFRTKIHNLIHSIKNYINFIKFNKKPNVSLFKMRVVKNIKENIDINLKQIFSKFETENNLLKIDIEGGEYEIIDDILSNSSKINMLIIEFHWINNKNKIFIDSICKLKNKFDIVHIHPNNYRQKEENEDFFDVVEITFVNNNINKFNEEFRYSFPINGLDFECFPNHKKIEFSFKKDS